MIHRITNKEASGIISKREPRGLFCYIDITNGKEKHVGIDNRTGDAWTEEFDSLCQCQRWLEDEMVEASIG